MQIGPYHKITPIAQQLALVMSNLFPATVTEGNKLIRSPWKLIVSIIFSVISIIRKTKYFTRMWE